MILDKNHATKVGGGGPLPERRRNYQCRHCLKIVKRASNKSKIKSYCTSSDREVYLMAVSVYGIREEVNDVE